jgi:hypothetical protein
MIKKLKLLPLLLLIPLASFCLIDTNSLYNGAIVRTNTNVFYVFDSTTVDGIVKDIIRGDECKETQDSLKSIIKDYSFLSETKSKQIRTIETINSFLREKLTLKDEEIALKDNTIKKEKRKNKWNKIGIYIVGGVAILEGAAITTIILLK